MLFLIPHLFPSTRLLEVAAQDLRLPALETLLARGSRHRWSAEGLEAALCAALGISRQQDWPVAPITLEADGGTAGSAYWLRADPVHLRVMRDRIMLADSSLLNLSQHEANALAASIGSHFGSELNPLPLRSQRWYLRLSSTPRLTTTSLSMATGCDIDPLLPRGEDALRYRALLNELQMLLHGHPVNQAREARGELPVNSLWLWGGGSRPVAPESRLALFADDDDEVHALGRFCRAQLHPLPRRMEKPLLTTESVLVLDALVHAGQAGDPYGWREALRILETDWFEPLLDGLRWAGGQGVRLADPVSGTALDVRRADAWKIWRRSPGLISLLA